MRERLKALKNKKRPTFSATFQRFGRSKNNAGEQFETALLINVRYKGKIIASHIWITEVKQLKKLNPQKGDVIQFEATISCYLRGYLGKDQSRNHSKRIELDYDLIHLSTFRIISRYK